MTESNLIVPSENLVIPGDLRPGEWREVPPKALSDEITLTRPSPASSYELEFEGENLDPDLLPDPVGYRMLVAPVVIKDMTDGGIFLTDQTKSQLNYLRTFGKVLKMGDDAYNHEKFHGKPWCKVGDIIQFHCYDGQVVHICPENMVYTFRIVNDDSIFTTVKNPKTLNFL